MMPPPRGTSEAALLRSVLKLCEKHHVLVFHDNDSRKNEPGFPDLVLCGWYSVIFVELKTNCGQLSSEQTVWRYRLLAAGQRFEIWRPDDLAYGHIESVLESL